MYAHLFLDFDGVVHRSATEQLKRSFGTVVRERLPLGDAAIDSIFTALQALPSRDALTSFFDWVGVDDVSEAIERVYACEPVGWDGLPDADGIDPAVVSLVRAASDAGTTVDILSTGSPAGERAVAALDALSDFGVAWLRTEGRSKADPDTYRRSVASKNDARPGECVLVDDSVVAVSAAESIGVRAYYSAHGEARTTDHGRNWRLDEIEDELFGRRSR